MTFKKTFEDSAGGAGVSDHGSLTGLSDDDHPQYLTQAEADALYKALGYIPSWAEITGKPTTFPPSAHKASHATGGADALAASDIGAAPGSHVGSTGGHPLATTTLAGFQSAADKTKLTGIGAFTRIELGQAQSIPDKSFVPVSFTAEVQDDRNWWVSTTPARVTVDVAGVYTVFCFGDWALNSTGARFCRITQNGVAIMETPGTDASSQASGRVTASISSTAIAGDYLGMEVYQSSGAALDLRRGFAGSPNPFIVVVREA